jgi:hypothetical protein
LPALVVKGQFATPGPDTAGQEAKPFFPTKQPFRLIHEEILPSTDLAIHVLLSTPKQQLEQDMAKLFLKANEKN